MAQIGQNTITECAEQLKTLLETHKERLNVAYIKAGSELAISLSLKIKPGPGKNHIVAGISFVVEKETDTSSFSVDEEQLAMEFDKEGYQS